MVANKFKLNLFTVLLNPNYSFLTLPAGKSAGSDVSICAKMENTMITGGNATVYVSDMDRAVSFYVNVLGLKLGQRFGNHWAEIKPERTGHRAAYEIGEGPSTGHERRHLNWIDDRPAD